MSLGNSERLEEELKERIRQAGERGESFVARTDQELTVYGRILMREFREREQQKDKCLRGEHEAEPERYAFIGGGANPALLPHTCRHCRCLFVEKP